MLHTFSIRFAAAVAGVSALCSAESLAAGTAPFIPLPAAHAAPLLIAPDRGFQGNEELRDALETFTQGTLGEIVFVTDERTRETLRSAMQRLANAGASNIVVLPFFLSASDPCWALAQRCLTEWTNSIVGSSPRVVQARVFGQTCFAVEILADRFRAIPDPAGRDVIIVGSAPDAGSCEPPDRLEADWQRLATLAAEGFGFKSVRAVNWPARAPGADHDKPTPAERPLDDLVIHGDRVAVVPFHLGAKRDGMMTFNADLRSKVPKAAEWIECDVTPHPAVTLWIAREVNRQTRFRPEDLGVVFLAHGADYHWNETLREAVAPLTNRYKIDFCFSMADPPLVERAVRRLEQRGARAIVVVRVFALTESFERDVKRMLGLDAEEAFATHEPRGEPVFSSDAQLRADNAPATVPGMADMPGMTAPSHENHHGHAGVPPPRIQSSALLATAGGLEDHPFFASALLDRAKALSKNPARETVILVAHGSGDDAVNDYWRRILESLATQIRTNGAAQFRAIRTGTWREDWPDKRAPELAAVRSMLEEAAGDGGRALLIPARVTGQGSERAFLKGLDFELGAGFVPHPLFARWVEAKIREGVSALQLGGLSSATPFQTPRSQ